MRNNINQNSVNKLAESIKSCYAEFKTTDFVSDIIPFLEPLGLFERLNVVTKSLYKYLPKKYEDAINIILKSVKDENGFIVLSLSNYIADYGLNYFDLSMNGLVALTKNFSSEFAIRPFLIEYPVKSLDYLRVWVKDESPHVRRLVSEGTRPRLPWGIKLDMFVKDPTPILEFLELLKDDEELFVRRSVANNLNDITKDNPARVIQLLKTWKTSGSDNVMWVIKHALRTLVKKGNVNALEILGYNRDSKIEVSNIIYTKSVVFPGYLEFSFNIESTSLDSQNLVIDYVIHYKKANGTNSPKVYKLKNIVLKSKDVVTISKRQHLKTISTRLFYSGEHFLYIKINGKDYYCGKFNLQI